jgi:diaminohydroxyphosphoribosylaminopyrimidine deaminase/5-amino-6-(5-phosphoribosylamino)uracil reductase
MSLELDDIYISQAEYYMQECFELAKNALGRTSPNPIVGAIVLDKEGVPVGRGFHQKSGEDHAEVIAIKEAGEKAKGGTLFVSLEPCCHFGKTPPCTDLIIKSGISQVYFSNYDPNPLVNASGEQKLSESNIKVFSRVLEDDGEELNKFFLKWIKTKLPWVTLKQAQTLDAKVSLSKGKETSITSEESKVEVHRLRNTYDAVLVGSNTVNVDDPELTVRLVENSRNPKRIVLDVNLETSPSAKIYKSKKYDEVFLVTKSGQAEKLKEYKTQNPLINIVEVDQISEGKLDLKKLFIKLGEQNILSVLVEAGPNLAGELIESSLIDEYILFMAPKIFGNEKSVLSVHLPQIDNGNSIKEFRIINHKLIGNDLMVSLRPKP